MRRLVSRDDRRRMIWIPLALSLVLVGLCVEQIHACLCRNYGQRTGGKLQCTVCGQVEGGKGQPEIPWSVPTPDNTMHTALFRYDRKWETAHYLESKWNVAPSKVGQTKEQPFYRCFKYVTASQDPDGIYTPTDPTMLAGTVVEYTSATDRYELFARGYRVVQTGSGTDVTVYAPSGKILSEGTYTGSVLTSLTEGPDLSQMTYDGSDRVIKMEVKRDTTPIRTVYTYYTETAGELSRMRITQETYNSDGTKRFLTTIYAYYGDTGDDKAYQLYFVVQPDGVARLLADNAGVTGVDPANPGNQCGLDTVADATLDDYAETIYNDYDADERVTNLTHQGCGGCGGGGIGAYTYAYGTNPSYPGSPTDEQKYNTWKEYRRTTEPSTLRRVEFTNTYGGIVYSVVQEMSGTTILRRWITHYKYGYSGGNEGHVIELRHPSACTGYSAPASGGWTTNVTSNDNGTDGLVDLSSYDTDDNLEWSKVREGTKPSGSGGNPEYYTGKYTYTSVTYGEMTSYRVETETRYPSRSTSDNPADKEVTSHAYTYFQDGEADTHSVLTHTVTHPTVGTNHNGSGVAITETTHYKKILEDSEQRYYYNDWSKAGDGTLSYSELDSDGQLSKTIQDVDTNRPLDFSDLPAGWSHSGGVHLISAYTYDAYGRSDTTTTPGDLPGAGGYWDFDKSSGAVLPDWSGSGNDGTTYGISAADWVAGKYNNALNFDGVNNRVWVPADDTLKIYGDLTIAAWIYTDTLPPAGASRPVLIRGGNGETYAANLSYSLFVYNDSGTLRLRYWHEYGEGSNEIVTSTRALPTGQWVHVVAVRDTTAKTVTIYLDGVSETAQSYTNNPIGGSTAGVYIGYNWASAFTGKLDELYIYAAKLSRGQVVSLMRPYGGRTTKTAYTSSYDATRNEGTTIALVTLTAPRMDQKGYYDFAPMTISMSKVDGDSISAAGVATTDEDGNLVNDWERDESHINDAFNGTLTARADSINNSKGQLEQTRSYHNIPTGAGADGSLGTNYYLSWYRYDSTTGRKIRDIQVASGTDPTSVIQGTGCVEQVTKYIYDQLGRTTEIHRIVSPYSQAMGNDFSNEAGLTFKKVSASFYDQSTPGSGGSGVGDGYVTSSISYYDAADYNNNVKAIYYYDYRGMLRGAAGEAAPYAVTDYDNMGRTLASAQFNSNSNFGANWATVLGDLDYAENATDSNRRSLSKIYYDEMGRTYRSETYAVNPVGLVMRKLTSNSYYDQNSRTVATESTGGGATEMAYDGLGRVVETRIVTELKATKYSSGVFQYRDPQPGVTSGGDDKVFQISRTRYDRGGNGIASISMAANHDNTSGIDLTNNDYVQTTSFTWYDLVDRTTASAAFGTYTTAWTYAARPTRRVFPPNRYDIVLVTSYTYDSAGRMETFTDPRGLVAKSSYDDLGRTIKMVENYVATPSSADQSRTTCTQYDGLSNVTKQIADIDRDDTYANGVWTTDADSQVTVYSFTDTYSASLPTKIKYPDSADSTWDVVTLVYDLDGQVATRTAQKAQAGDDANEITYEYDATYRRLIKQRVTTVGTGVDDSVRAILTDYDTMGRAHKVSSYSQADPDPGSDTPVNQVKYAFNQYQALEYEYQAHGGAVSESSTPYVAYNYDGMPTGQVAYWAFDESSGTSAPDWSGEGNNGTTQNMTDADWVAGKINNALDFDGSDDYVNCTSDASLEIAGDVTITAWIWLDQTPSGQTRYVVISRWADGETEAANILYNIRIGKHQGKVRIQFLHEYGAGDDETLTSTAEVSVGQWVHVAVVRDAAAKKIKFFVDGVAEAAQSYTNNATGGTTTVTYVARGEGAYFDGKIDEVNVYGRALADEDVKALMDPYGTTDVRSLRLTSVVYPNGRRVHYTYGAAGSINDILSRVADIKDDTYGTPSTTMTFSTYSYNGDGTIVVEDYSQPEVRLDYWGQASGTYAGFDRFGRIQQQLWRDYGAPADRDKFSYGYDRNSNRLYRKNELSTTRSELYHTNNATANEEYDGLDRLIDFRRGTLAGDKRSITGTPTDVQDWALDGVGNWSGFVVKASGTTTLDQTRTNNKANEITDIAKTVGSDWIDPAYSARGNMTSGPKPGAETTRLHFKYDAWNRLVEVRADDGGSPGDIIVTYRFDGTGRRIRKLLGTNPASPDNTYDYFFNNSWQILEVRKDGLAVGDLYEQYIWSLRYIDSPILRDRDTGGDPDLDERLYYLNDANFNVTTLVDTAGDAQERYVYEPYGEVTIYNSDWSSTITWAASKKNEIQYCGYRYNPETGLSHVRNRAYHPTLGRWLQRDPAPYGDGMNLYEYVRSRPVVGLDASGLQPVVFRQDGWVVARSAEDRRGIAWTKKADYIGKLAAAILLDPSDIKKWLKRHHTMANRPVRLMNGQRKFIKDLKPTDRICPGEYFTIPNKVAVVYGKDVAYVTPATGPKSKYQQYRGWAVIDLSFGRYYKRALDQVEHSIWAEGRKVEKFRYPAGTKNIRAILGDEDLWAFTYGGHGSGGGGIKAGDLASSGTAPTEKVVNHRLAFILLLGCYTGDTVETGPQVYSERSRRGRTKFSLWELHVSRYGIFRGMRGAPKGRQLYVDRSWLYEAKGGLGTRP